MKPLIVGESNPFGADPRFALYPEPRGATGDRLCRMIMGLSGGRYMERFDRVNLCTGSWSIERARERAREILEQDGLIAVVLLGSKVCHGFGLRFVPFTVEHLTGSPNKTLVTILPHPSGLNRMWLEHGAVDRARAALIRGGISLNPNKENE